MIIGECPYCEKVNTTAISDECPGYSKETCENCKKEYWLKHSRIIPMAYPLEYFEVRDGKLFRGENQIASKNKKNRRST